jgi:hypothetical protein
MSHEQCDTTMQGSCLCGAVNYEITGAFSVVGHCHCSMCRKSHGVAFTTWGILKPGQFRWSSGLEFVQGFKSSPERERCFCRKCGSPLASRHGRDVTEVVIGTIDGDPGLRPTEHIFVKSKAPWHEIADGLPQYEEWPPGLADV